MSSFYLNRYGNEVAYGRKRPYYPKKRYYAKRRGFSAFRKKVKK